MASPGTLVRSVALALRVPEITVVQHDRNLVVAGKRSKGGRGRSAARMTSEDASNLLIATAASSMAKDTLETLSDYVELPQTHNERSGPEGYAVGGAESWSLANMPVSALTSLPEQHTFGQALVGLLSATADGSLGAAFLLSGERESTVRGFPINLSRIEVRFFSPYPHAVIEIRGFKTVESMVYGPGRAGYASNIADQPDPGDLSQIRLFTHRTVFAVGGCLRT